MAAKGMEATAKKARRSLEGHAGNSTAKNVGRSTRKNGDKSGTTNTSTSTEKSVEKVTEGHEPAQCVARQSLDKNLRPWGSRVESAGSQP